MARRAGQLENTREWVVSPAPYIVVYRLKNVAVNVASGRAQAATLFLAGLSVCQKRGITFSSPLPRIMPS